MSDREAVRVCSTAALCAVVADWQVREVLVVGRLTDVPTLRLWPGVRLGGAEGAALRFAAGQDGVRLSRDNDVYRLELHADPGRRAVYNDTAQRGMGTMRLLDVVVTGQVQLVADRRVRSGSVYVEDLTVRAADTRRRVGWRGGHRSILQGAFTLWNRQTASDALVTASVLGLRIGTPFAPVHSSGVFVAAARRSGAEDGRGGVHVRTLHTGEIHVDGRLPAAGARRSAALCLLGSATATRIRNRAAVTTYGPHDLALFSLGRVRRWSVDAELTSHGAEATAVLVGGSVGQLRLAGPVETSGTGASGVHICGGRVRTMTVDRIVTGGDGAAGLRVDGRLDRLVVHRGIDTYGGRSPETGNAACAMWVSAAGAVHAARIRQGLTSSGDDVAALKVAGVIERLHLHGGVHSTGRGSVGVHLDGGSVPLHDTEVTSLRGIAIRSTGRPGPLPAVRARGAFGDVVTEPSGADRARGRDRERR